MKLYTKPLLLEEEVIVEDVIASSTLDSIINSQNTNDVTGGFGNY